MSVLRLPPLLLAFVLGLLAAVAVACGDDGDDRRLLAPSRADVIREELDKVAERVEAGKCDALNPAFKRLRRAIDGLPQSTDRELRRRLADGAEHLEAIAPGECRDNRPETATTETEPETVPETVPETTTTETEPRTETEPPQADTTPPPTEPPAETVPEDDTGGSEAPESGFVPPGQAKKGGEGKG